jgi:hypothetical protein
MDKGVILHAIQSEDSRSKETNFGQKPRVNKECKFDADT